MDDVDEILRRLDALEGGTAQRGAGGPQRRVQGHNRVNRFNPYRQTTPAENFGQVLTDTVSFAVANPMTTLSLVAAGAYAMGRHPVRLFFDIAFALLPMPRMPMWPTLPALPVMPTMPWPW
jgi:hypothetical protein